MYVFYDNNINTHTEFYYFEYIICYLFSLYVCILIYS